MDVDWEEIKTIWQTGIGSLTEAAEKYDINLPEIMLRAREEKWGNRSSETSIEIPVEDLDFDQVSESYRLSMLKIKKLSDSVIDAMASVSNNSEKIEALDKLSKILSRIMPLSVNASHFRGIKNAKDEEIADIILRQQIKAIKQGDIKMLMFLGKQYLNQRDQLDLYTKEILATMEPKDAARLYQEMIKDDSEM